MEEVKIARSLQSQKVNTLTKKSDGVLDQVRKSEECDDGVQPMMSTPLGDDAKGDATGAVGELRRRVDHLHTSLEDLRTEMRSSRSDIEGLLGKIADSVDALHARNASAAANPAGQIYRDAPRLPRSAGLVVVPNSTRSAGSDI